MKNAQGTNAVIGTSFHRIKINTTVEELEKALWPPINGVDKTQWEWQGRLEDGTPFTIYDFKESIVIERTTNMSFHIGGRNQLDCIRAKEEIENAIQNIGG